MKALKFEHTLAALIQTGAKTSTWRFYDDKDISVNDELNLIDKVEPHDPSTWRIFARARVDMVVEKRLGDLTEADMEGHEKFSSREAMLMTYQSYYGPQVTFETPVKIIHFELIEQGRFDKSDVEKTPHISELKLYADGGSRGNPGPSASGYVLMDMDNRIIMKAGVYIGVTTNNQAEYQALKLAFEEARKLDVPDVHVYMDSLLVINQMLGVFKVKNRDLWPIHDEAVRLSKQFRHVSFTHVPRELNKLADAEVNEALDSAAETDGAG